MPAGNPAEQRGAGTPTYFSGAMRRAIAGAVLAAGATANRYLRPRLRYNVLHLKLAGDSPETETGWRIKDLGVQQRSPDLVTLLAALRSAREDPDLGLLLADIHGLTLGWSRIQSLRRGLFRVRAAGKRVWAYLSQPAMSDYYLATAADRVFLAPGAIFDATGLATEVIFLKGLLDKVGVEAQLAQAGRFKSAAEPFTRTDMSAEHRTMVDGLLDDLYAQLAADIAAARGISEDAVRAAFEEGPLLAREALARGLVDALAYPDQVDEALADLFGDPAPISLGRYQRRRALAVRRAALRSPVVGYLAVTGTIGLADAIPAVAGSQTGSWRVFRRELAAMASDARLGAIVIRVDSPGGSGLASDLMWREISEARRRKPVVVSMGDVAASGGYYLAAAADHVTAEPATLTGSIGVLAGKPVLRGLYDRLGVNKELVVRGNAARHSDYVRLDTADLARLRAEAEAFYGDFVAKVAAGRGLSPEAVERVAEGRVWTGRQALERGLVDCLGGLEQTFEEVKRRLGIEPEAPLAIDRRPRARPIWRQALGWQSPTGDLTGEFSIVAPVLAGERLLATMPFVMRFVTSHEASGAQELATNALSAAFARGRLRPLRGAVHLLWLVLGAFDRMCAALQRPPLVL